VFSLEKNDCGFLYYVINHQTQINQMCLSCDHHPGVTQ